MGDFIGSTWFFVSGGVLVAVLIGVYFMVKNKKDED